MGMATTARESRPWILDDAWLVLDIFIGLFYVASAVMIALVYTRRNTFPLYGKKPGMIIMTILAFMLFQFPSLSSSFIPCPIFPSVWVICTVLAPIVYVYRLVILVFDFKITENIIQLQQDPFAPVGWHLDHRSAVSTPFLAKTLVLALILPVGVAIMGNFEGCYESVGTLATYVLLLGALGAGLFWAKFIWNLENDGFGIRAEFKRALALSAVLLFAVVVGEIVGKGDYDNYNVNAFLSFFYAVLASGCAAVPALYESYKVEREGNVYQDLDGENGSMLDIICTKPGYEAMLDFLKSEFSAENLLFWKAVQEIKGLQGQKLRDRVQAVVEDYIKSGSRSEVNISSEERNTTLKDVQTKLLASDQGEKGSDKALEQVFSVAEEAVIELMQRDSFVRFRGSAFFKALEEEWSSQKKEHVFQDTLSRLQKSRFTADSIRSSRGSHEGVEEMEMSTVAERPSSLAIDSPRRLVIGAASPRAAEIKAISGPGSIQLNADGNETRSEKPIEVKVDIPKEQEPTPQEEEPQSSEGSLPEGWRLVENEGNPFFWHEESERSVWAREDIPPSRA